MTLATPCFANLQKMNPFAAPNWRWERAQELFDRGSRCLSRLDDEPTRIAVAYFRAKQRSREEVRMQFPRIVFAERLFRSDPSEHIRTLIEARLLAGQTPEDIEKAEGHSAEVIRAYAALFFDVAPRLQARDWIFSRVMWDLEYGSRIDQARPVYLAAYLWGPATVETCARLCLSPPRSTSPQTVQDCVDAKMRLQLSLLGWDRKDMDSFVREAMRTHQEIAKIDALRARFERQSPRSTDQSPSSELVGAFISGALEQASARPNASADPAPSASRQVG